MSSISEIYELLLSLLTKCPQTIEILPGDGWVHPQDSGDMQSEPSFAPFLFVEGNLGIPQKMLYKVYLYAVGVFKSVRTCVPTRPIATQCNPNIDPSLARVLADSSSILLLANPSHQTALNARKHLVRISSIDPHIELRFTASLLSSQHCAKHAELWYHRRWLLSAARRSESLNTTSMDPHRRFQFQSQEALLLELRLVSRACELYPRNYFAWTHRLICMRSLLSDYLAGLDAVDFVPMFRNEIAGIKGWIDHHVSDYSAIHYILSLCQATYQSGESSLVEIIVEKDLLEHAISLVQEYPAHEALWTYIWAVSSQTILGLQKTQQEAEKIQQFIDHFVQPLVDSKHMEIGVKEGVGMMSHHASVFLEKKSRLTFFECHYICSSTSS